MRRLIPLAAVLLALAACGEKGSKDVAPPGSEPQPDPPPGPVGPPVATPASYVGVWAASPELCRNGAWNVRADGLETAGEVSCNWNPADVRSGEGQSTVDATCHAEGEASSATLTLAGDGDSLAITGGPFTGVPLARCSNSAP